MSTPTLSLVSNPRARTLFLAELIQSLNPQPMRCLILCLRHLLSLVPPALHSGEPFPKQTFLIISHPKP